ncbi:MAG: glycerophosphodiester phosphodiesterase [Nevskiales bacterium]
MHTRKTYRIVPLVLLLAVTACNDSSPQGKLNSSENGGGGRNSGVSPFQKHQPIVIADQGDCQFAPENTLVAMRNGLRHGVVVLEADLNITADNELVLIHDGTLDRTTNCSGNVHDKTLAEIRDCDAAYWWVPGEVPGIVPVLGAIAVGGELIGPLVRNPSDGRDYAMRGGGVQVPTLREFFQFALDRELPLMAVEIKNIPYDSNFDLLGRRMADVLVPLIVEYGLTQRVIVESFWPTSLERVKELNPEIVTSFLTLGSATENYAVVSLTASEHSSSDLIAPDFNQTYVDNVHALGKLVLPWAVDSAADAELVKNLGADGLYTCHNVCMLEALGRPAPRPIVTPEAGVNYDVPACPA